MSAISQVLSTRSGGILLIIDQNFPAQLMINNDQHQSVQSEPPNQRLSTLIAV